jgi:hypothetical protein
VITVVHSKIFNPHHLFTEKEMRKALKNAQPVIEATVISLVLVIAALAVPAAIVYAAA